MAIYTRATLCILAYGPRISTDSGIGQCRRLLLGSLSSIIVGANHASSMLQKLPIFFSTICFVYTKVRNSFIV